MPPPPPPSKNYIFSDIVFKYITCAHNSTDCPSRYALRSCGTLTYQLLLLTDAYNGIGAFWRVKNRCDAKLIFLSKTRYFCQNIHVPFHTFSQCYVRENTVSTVGSPCTGEVDHVQLEKMDG